MCGWCVLLNQLIFPGVGGGVYRDHSSPLETGHVFRGDHQFHINWSIPGPRCPVGEAAVAEQHRRTAEVHSLREEFEQGLTQLGVWEWSGDGAVALALGTNGDVAIGQVGSRWGLFGTMMLLYRNGWNGVLLQGLGIKLLCEYYSGRILVLPVFTRRSDTTVFGVISFFLQCFCYHVFDDVMIMVIFFFRRQRTIRPRPLFADHAVSHRGMRPFYPNNDYGNLEHRDNALLPFQ